MLHLHAQSCGHQPSSHDTVTFTSTQDPGIIVLTLRSPKRSKDLIQPHESTGSLIMHIYTTSQKIKEQILAQLVHFLNVSSNTIFHPGPPPTQPPWYTTMQLLIQLSVISACTIRQSPSSHVISQSCSYSPTQPPMLHPHPQPCSHQPSYIHIHNHAAPNLPCSQSTTKQFPTSKCTTRQVQVSQAPNAHNPDSFHPTICMVCLHHQAVTNFLWSTCTQSYSSQPPTLCLYICMHNQEAMRLQF